MVLVGSFCAEFGVQRAVNVATSYCAASDCAFVLAKREIALRLLTDQPATQLLLGPSS